MTIFSRFVGDERGAITTPIERALILAIIAVAIVTAARVINYIAFVR